MPIAPPITPVAQKPSLQEIFSPTPTAQPAQVSTGGKQTLDQIFAKSGAPADATKSKLDTIFKGTATSPNNASGADQALGQVGAGAADIGAKIDTDLYGRAKNIIAGIQEGTKNLQEGTVSGGVKSVMNAGVNAAGQVAGGALDIIKEPLNAFIKAAGEALSNADGIKSLANAKPTQDFLSAFSSLVGKGEDFYKKFVTDHPDTARLLENAGNIAAIATGGGAEPKVVDLAAKAAETAKSAMQPAVDMVASTIKKGAEAGANIISDAAGNAIDAAPGMGTKSPGDVVSGAIDNYTKAIKPSVAGKGDAAAVQSYQDRVMQALNAIHENKQGLELTDAEGNVTKGETPKSVSQLSDAISQTKTDIFKRYDAMAQAAGESGAKVDMKPVASELDDVINSKALGIKDPGLIEYAKNLQARYVKEGELDAKTTQELIASYNESLKAYYRNPTYETASRAAVDALVANRLRTGLDASIEGATGPGYQGLKNQYGALRTIEADVAKRGQVIARQSTPGFAGNLSNIASGAELVRGLLTMNPTDLAVSGTIKGLQLFNKWRNNPDRLISNIFSSFDKAKASNFAGSTPSGIKYTISPQ